MSLPETDAAVRARLDADPELAAYVDGIINGAEAFARGMAAVAVRNKTLLLALLDSLGGTVMLDLDLGEHDEAYAHFDVQVVRDGRYLRSLEIVARDRLEATAGHPVTAEQLSGTLAALGRARWREDGMIIRLVAANRDGGAVLASIDLSDQWQYSYVLHDGRKGSGWPLMSVQRHVRKQLREAELALAEGDAE